MRIGVTSQNFRTITGHAGKTRRFLIYATQEDGSVREVKRLDLPKHMSMHEYHGDDHPVFELNVVITAGHGEGFARRLAARGIEVVATSDTDPLAAARAIAFGGNLAPPLAHSH